MSCAGEEADASPGRGGARHRVRDPVAGVTRRGFGSIRSQRIEVRARLTRGAGCPRAGAMGLVAHTADHSERSRPGRGMGGDMSCRCRRRHDDRSTAVAWLPRAYD